MSAALHGQQHRLQAAAAVSVMYVGHAASMSCRVNVLILMQILDMHILQLAGMPCSGLLCAIYL